MFIFLLLDPEQRTKSPGFPASQLASEHMALVTDLGSTLKLPIRLVSILWRKMKEQNLQENGKRNSGHTIDDHHEEIKQLTSSSTKNYMSSILRNLPDSLS
jgi:hypothetical protein